MDFQPHRFLRIIASHPCARRRAPPRSSIITVAARACTLLRHRASAVGRHASSTDELRARARAERSSNVASVSGASRLSSVSTAASCARSRFLIFGSAAEATRKILVAPPSRRERRRDAEAKRPARLAQVRRDDDSCRRARALRFCARAILRPCAPAVDARARLAAATTEPDAAGRGDRAAFHTRAARAVRAVNNIRPSPMPRRAARRRANRPHPAQQGQATLPGRRHLLLVADRRRDGSARSGDAYDLAEVELCALLGARARGARVRARARRSRRRVRVRLRDRRPCANFRAPPRGAFWDGGARWSRTGWSVVLPADVRSCDGTIAIAVTRMVPLPHPVRVRRFADRAERRRRGARRRRPAALPRRPAALAARGRLDGRRRTAQWFGLRSNAGVLGGGGDAGGGAHTDVECTVDARFMAACAAHGDPARSVPHGTDAFIRDGRRVCARAGAPRARRPRAALEPLRKGGRRAPAGRRRPAFEPPAPPPRPFFRTRDAAPDEPSCRARSCRPARAPRGVARLPARAGVGAARRGY